MNMRLKFFRNAGHDGLLRIEKEVNQWLEKENPKIEKVETNMCSVADSPQGEMFQYTLVSIWYEE